MLYRRGMLADYSSVVSRRAGAAERPSGADELQALVDYYRVTEPVLRNDTEGPPSDPGDCERLIRNAWAQNCGRIYLSPQTAQADCAIFRLALSDEPQDILLLLRLGCEAPRAWSKRILHDALLPASDRICELPPAACKKIAAQLVTAYRQGQDRWQSIELPIYFPRPPYELRDESYDAIICTLDALMAGNVVSREDMRAMAFHELAQVKSVRARKAVKQLIQGFDRRWLAFLDNSVRLSRGNEFRAWLKEYRVRLARARMGRIGVALDRLVSHSGFYPASLDEVAVELGTSGVTDPLSSDSHRFAYESDGTSYILTSAISGSEDYAYNLVWSSEYAIDSEFVKRARAPRAVRPAATPVAYPTPVTVADQTTADDALDRLLLLRMMLSCFRQERGSYPHIVEEVFVPDSEYLRMIGDPTLVPLAQACARADHRVHAPKGYQWYYRSNRDGSHYLLGFKRDGEEAPDVVRMPVVSTQQPGGEQVQMPWYDHARTAVARFQE